MLRRQLGRMPLLGTVKFGAVIFIISGLAGFAALYVYGWFLRNPEYEILPRGLTSLLSAGLVFSVLFLLEAYVLRIHELRIVLNRLNGKFRRKKTPKTGCLAG